MKTPFVLTVLVLLLALALPALAQDTDLSQTFELPEGYVISAPHNWELTPDTNTDGVYLSGDGFDVYILTPPQVAAVIDIPADPDIKALLVTVNQELYDWEPNSDEVVGLAVGRHLAVRVSYEVEGGKQEGYSYLIRMADGEFAFVDATAPTGELDPLSDALADILGTFEVASAAAPSAGSSEPCYVSTDQANVIKLRVGPGENRTSVAFLPADQDFAAQAQFVGDDDSVWYRLDKAEAAPKSSAAEIWVAQQDVEETGDCAALVDAAAPPVIPIAVNPPAAGGGDSGASAGTTGGAVDTSVVPGAVPNSGTWTISLALFANASCAGGANVPVNTAEVMKQTSWTTSISVGAGGQSLTFEGTRLQLTKPGSYSGVVSDGSGSYRYFLNVINSNLITGQLIFTSRDQSCSATIDFTATR